MPLFNYFSGRAHLKFEISHIHFENNAKVEIKNNYRCG